MYTALCYAMEKWDNTGQNSRFVAFDQLLYIKAIEKLSCRLSYT